MLGPLLVRCLEYRIDKISPVELEARMSEAIGKLHFIPRDFDEGKEKSKKSGLTKIHTDVLGDLAVNLFISMDQRQRNVGNLHPEYYHRLLKDLQEMGFLGPLEECRKGKGKPFKTALVTEKGAELLGLKYEECIPPGKGSCQHKYLQHLIKIKVNGVIEVAGADVVAYGRGLSVAYEVELASEGEHFLRNIERDLLQFTRVVVVAQNLNDKKKLMKIADEKLNPDILNAVAFKTIIEIMEEK